jgi:hypothetical protein
MRYHVWVFFTIWMACQGKFNRIQFKVISLLV